MSDLSIIENSLKESISTKEKLLSQKDTIASAAEIMRETLRNGGTIYFAGNGGSAADAQHMAAELVGRFEKDNRLPAQALTTDSSILTALANDFGYDEVFSRQAEALMRPGDCFVAISTSGNSVSINKAAETALRKGAKVVALTGKDGGKLKDIADCAIIVPSPRTCRIQESHITVGHILCELIEAKI